MNFVVGSGPAGVACAQALLARGVPVTMLDAGLTLEPARQQQLTQLAAQPPSAWTNGAGSFLREGMQSKASGIPLKLTYGSDYPYRSAPGATPVEFVNAKASPSNAAGGLSTVWGSSVLPYHQRDMAGWPIAAADLAPAYEAIFRFIPLSARVDDLAADFPLYTEAPHPLPMSRQAAQLLKRLERRRASLAGKGIAFGSARLAVDAGGHNGTPACAQCGLCMYGCPSRLIYSSDSTLEQMRSNPNFHYIPGIVVQSVEESGSEVTIRAVDATGTHVSFRGDRVFLAAGVYPTTAILLRSLQRFNAPVPLVDSQYFLLPFLRAAGAGKVTEEKLHTLAQLYLEITDPAVSPYTVHMQTYTYNDLFKAPVESALGPLRGLFPINAFLGRLMLFQGYLHSDHSAVMTATLQSDSSGERLRVDGITNPATRVTLKKLIRKIATSSAALGAIPLVPLLQLGEAGRGYHTGGSFPMAHQPTESQSDIYGRPAGLQRVHAVDSSVFPSIAATTITLTAMANAYRVGSQLEHYA
jgi:choline dehydrogenase-like flavoprotein